MENQNTRYEAIIEIANNFTLNDVFDSEIESYMDNLRLFYFILL
jgi:hypothetical protein